MYKDLANRFLFSDPNVRPFHLGDIVCHCGNSRRRGVTGIVQDVVLADRDPYLVVRYRYLKNSRSKEDTVDVEIVTLKWAYRNLAIATYNLTGTIIGIDQTFVKAFDRYALTREQIKYGSIPPSYKAMLEYNLTLFPKPIETKPVESKPEQAAWHWIDVEC